MFVAPKTDILDDLQTWPAVPGKKKVIIFLTRNQEFSSMLVFFFVFTRLTDISNHVFGAQIRYFRPNP